MQSGDFAKPPLRFGRYLVEKELGRGAMGLVYLARDTQLDRPVALKIPRLGASSSQKLLQRLATEAKAAARIDHPSVCPVYDSGDIGGIPYIAMKYIEGETLDKHLRKNPRTPAEAIDLVLRLAEGLAEAHAQRIYHRDLKPENIKLDRRGVPVIMDFGLAKLATLTSDAGATQKGSILGSPAYMSPEQASGLPETIDHRSDIYALGVILYELLTGQWPFMGSAMQVMAQKSVRPAPSPLSVMPALDPRLAAVCQKMIAREREDRFQNAPEVIAKLKEIDLSLPPKALPPAERTRVPAVERSQSRSETTLKGSRKDRLPAVTSRTIARAKSAGPIVWTTIAAGVLLVGAIGLWASGLVGVQTNEGLTVTTDKDAEPLREKLAAPGAISAAGRAADETAAQVASSAPKAPNSEPAIDASGIETGKLPTSSRIPDSVGDDDTSSVIDEGTSPKATTPPSAKPGARKGATTKAQKSTVRRGPAAKTKKAAVDRNEFVPLFNGRDLSGWRTHTTQPGKWRVENGILIGSGTIISHLYSERQDYDDFHLRAEARINEGGNSGVFFRGSSAPELPPSGPKWPGGYEAQINNSGKDPRKTGTLLSAGSPPLVEVSESRLSDGEWFLLEIIAQGNRLTVKVAGQTIADIDQALERLAKGTYGYSEASGRPIPRERLEAIPWATELVEEKVGGIGRR
jgi:serine/threonine protein kinase